MNTVRVVRFEMNTKVVDEKDRLDRVGDCGEDFVYGDEEKGTAQRGVMRDPLDWMYSELERTVS